MYQSVDDHLMTLCKDNRTQPTDEESNDAVNVNLLEPFYTEAGARVDMQSSIGLMYRYVMVITVNSGSLKMQSPSRKQLVKIPLNSLSFLRRLVFHSPIFSFLIL